MPETTRRTEASTGFVELICTAPTWIRAEFDAIVTANFPSPPDRGRLPRPGSAGPVVPPTMGHTATDPTLSPSAPMPRDGRARQRFPPPAERIPPQRTDEAKKRA